MLEELEESDVVLKQQFYSLKQENIKSQAVISEIKSEKTTLNQHLLDLKRRVAELELMIGEDN